MGADPMLDATFAVAERVCAILEGQHVPAVVIGAIALAVHGYPRNTVDLDLAVAVPPQSLAMLTGELRREGWPVEISMPDAQDPLGGVINPRLEAPQSGHPTGLRPEVVNIRAPGAYLVQVVNFDNSPANGFPRFVREAVLTARPMLAEGGLKVVDLPLLVAFKLYAGGYKSRSDICELLDRHPEEIDQVRACRKALRLDKRLERILEDRELERDGPDR